MNISSSIERMARTEPDKIAVIGDNRHITYRQLDDAANRVARLLSNGYGIDLGDRVGIIAGSTIEFLVGFYGIVRAGGVAVPFHEEWTASEIEARVRDCGPAVVLMERGRRIEIAAGPEIAEIDLQPESPGSSPESTALTLALSQWERELSTSSLPNPPNREHSFYIGYTSGSTGQPKGVLRHHGSWLDSYLAATVEFGLTAYDKVFAPGPLFFSLSLFAVTHVLFLGGTACIISRFDPRRVLSVIEQEKVTTLCMVPTLYEALLEAASHHFPPDLSSVKKLICAGAAWPRADEAKREILDLFPAAGLYEYYGAAEMSFVSVSHPQDQMKRPRSVGRPFLGVQVEIRKDDGTLANHGETGTLYARSPFGFQRYYGDPGRTATVLQDEWMTVGDLASSDEEGYLYIIGRADNVVITGGANVNVEEVEAVLASYPKVATAAVLGIEDARRGQVLAALVQRRDGDEITIRELRQHCSANLASYKIPRKFRIVEALPLTATGKLNRPELPRLWESGQRVEGGGRR